MIPILNHAQCEDVRRILKSGLFDHCGTQDGARAVTNDERLIRLVVEPLLSIVEGPDPGPRSRPLLDVFGEVVAEMKRASVMHRPLPTGDPIRCAALLAEEGGEVAARALALTRPGADVVSLRADLRAEVLHVTALGMKWLWEGKWAADGGRRETTNVERDRDETAG